MDFDSTKTLEVPKTLKDTWKNPSWNPKALFVSSLIHGDWGGLEWIEGDFDL
jgi:hypothetical protein